jgi:hypothetical protein
MMKKRGKGKLPGFCWAAVGAARRRRGGNSFPSRFTFKAIGLALLAGVLIVFLSACAPVTRVEQPQSQEMIPITPLVGQTFTARYKGLAGISFYMQAQTAGKGSLRLRLYGSPPGSRPAPVLLAETILPGPESDAASPGYLTFQFAPQFDSDFQHYYVEVEALGSASAHMGTAPPESYLNGALYLAQQPQAAQARFNLEYNLPLAAAGLAAEGLFWLVLLASALALFAIPGWALLKWAVPSWPQQDWTAKLALSSGLSLALYPLLLLWTDLLGLHLGVWNAWGPVLAGAAALIWMRLKNPSPKRSMSATDAAAEEQPARTLHLPSTLVMIILLGLLVFVRLWAVRGLAAPLWGDSVQHTAIARLLVDQGGLFRSWEPVAPYGTFSVQYGFSAAAAALTWISGLNVVEAALYSGQIVNVLACLALYPLAVRLAQGSRWAGIGAVLAVGLLSPLPGGYANWGRFAQLTGQAVLPAALWLLWECAAPERALPSTWDSPHLSRISSLRRWQQAWGRLRSQPRLRRVFPPGALRSAAAAGMALGGMTLAYYRMPFFYAAFALVWLFAWLLPRLKLDWQAWVAVFARLALAGVMGIVLLLPWLPRLFSSELAGIAEGGLAGSPAAFVRSDFLIWRELPQHMPLILLGLAGLAVVMAVLRRDWMAAALPLWFVLLPLYVASQLFGVPGANMLQTFTLVIAVYIPVSLLLGWLLALMHRLLTARLALVESTSGWKTTASRVRAAVPSLRPLPGAPAVGVVLAQAVLAALVLGLALPAAVGQRGLIRPAEFALVTHPDRTALEWVQANTPKDSIFLVQAYRIHGGSSIVGSDAGWWLPVFTGRGTTVPPQYALFSETPLVSGYTQQVVQLAAVLEDSTPDEPAALQALCNLGVTHIFSGQREGQVGYGARRLFSPTDLDSSPAFQPLYAQDRVRIYAFDRAFCP